MASAAPATKAWFEPGLAPRRMVDGYWIPARCLLPGLRTTDAGKQVLVGPQAIVTDGIDSAGRLTLSRGVQVGGNVRAGGDIVVGPGCRIRGTLRSESRLIVQNSRVDGALSAAGDILLLGECQVGDVAAGGDIVVSGNPKTGRLEPGGRVSARAW